MAERYDFTETDDVSGFIVDGGLQRLSMSEVARRLNEAPRWMDRPNRPGAWIHIQENTGVRFINDFTQESLDAGLPLNASRVYGPIPEDKE